MVRVPGGCAQLSLLSTEKPMKHYLSNRSLTALSLGLSLAACGASADEDGASASAPGVHAQGGKDGVSATAPGVSAQANKNGAAVNTAPVDVATAQQALTELCRNVDGSVDGFTLGSPAAAVPPPPAGAAEGGDGISMQSINVPC